MKTSIVHDPAIGLTGNASAEPLVSAPYRLLACSGSLAGGGSERQLWQLVSNLDSRFAAEVYLLRREGQYLDQLPARVPIHCFQDAHPAPWWMWPGRLARLQVQHLRRVVSSRSIDIVYDRTFHMSLITGSACRRWPPRISVIVSPPSRDVPATERRWVGLKRWLLARAYRSAAATLCVSQEVADDAAVYYKLPSTCFTVIPNPIDCQRVAALSRHELAVSDQASLSIAPAIHVAIVGRFTAEKGHHFALETLAAYTQAIDGVPLATRPPPMHLHFVGDGPLQSEIAARGEQLGLRNQVHFHGYQSNPYPLMQRCAVVMVPSRYEGFPNVALEALALGVPLLMTDYGPTAGYLAGRTGTQVRARVVGVHDVQAAAAAVMDRWCRPEPWLLMAELGRQWVEQEHALGPWMQTMMQLSEQIILRSRGAR
jgi:glycosyltransferase involved in cell wall biosynthesis